MGCFAPDAPAPLDYGKQTAETLQAQINLNPQLASSNLAALNRMLMGTPAGPQQVTATQGLWWNPTTGATQDKMPLGPATPVLNSRGEPVGDSMRPGPATGWKYVNKGGQYMQNAAAQPGLLDLYSNTIAPALSASQTQANRVQRQADIADIANLGPEAYQAVMASNPDNAQLLKLLNSQAVEGLNAGTNMTPEEQRQIQQASRSAMAARGMGGTNASLGDELLQQYNMGQSLMRQRQNFALQTLGANQSVYDPMMALLGRPSGVVQSAPGWTSGAMGTAQIYNPESSYAGNIYNANQQMNALFADPSTMAKVGMVSSTLGKFVGAVSGALG